MNLPPRPQHPDAAAHFVIAGAVHSDDGVVMCVATCSCGWRLGVRLADQAELGDAVETHYQAVIAGAVAGRLARSP